MHEHGQSPDPHDTGLRKGQRTAERLLDAAERLFADRGYEATALRDVAEAVNIRQPGLYRHFDSKDALYRRVLERTLEPLTRELEAAMQRPADAASFRTLTDRLVDVLARNPHIPSLLIRSLLSPPSERDVIGLEWVERLADYGRRITRAADLTPDAPELAMQIVAIFNLMFGYFWAAPLIRSLSGVDPIAPDMIAGQKALLARLVNALNSGPGAGPVPDGPPLGV